MRYFFLLAGDRSAEFAEPPAIVCSLPVSADRCTRVADDLSGPDFSQKLHDITLSAAKAACDIVIFVPTASVEIAADCKDELAIACELAIRGYVSTLSCPPAATSTWWALAGKPLHAYGSRIERLSDAPLRPAQALPLSGIVVWNVATSFALDVQASASAAAAISPLSLWRATPERLALVAPRA